MAEQITLNRMLELVNEHSHLGLMPELLAGVAAAHLEALLAQPRHQEPLRLTRHRARVYSQDGTDGIVAEILARIGHAGPVRFLEIGAGDGAENNTRLWLECGGRGTWVEADPGRCDAIRAGFAPEIAAGRLRLVDMPITPANAYAVLGPAQPLELLSLDIDLHTSHVWRALSDWRPAVAVIEYNPNYPAALAWEVPYEAGAQWAQDNRFGASLRRLEEIADDLGYLLVGCDVTGINAYFVRGDLVDRKCFAAPFTAANHYEPPRFTLLRVGGHAPAQRAASGLERAA